MILADICNGLLFLQQLDAYTNGQECGLYWVALNMLICYRFVEAKKLFWLETVYLISLLQFIEISEISTEHIWTAIVASVISQLSKRLEISYEHSDNESTADFYQSFF
jgi:hypothetical protein